MPVYTYEHESESPQCPLPHEFEWGQPARDWPLTVCPHCGVPVSRLIQPAHIKRRLLNSELRDKGFTKLVRVDDGVFENVTRRGGEPKFVDRRDPATFPVLEKTIKD
jgi:hypothetical protein